MTNKKTVGIDLRLIEEDNSYHKFIINLVNKLIINEKKDFFIIYLNGKIEKLVKTENSKIVKLNIKSSGIKNQLLFYNKIKKDNTNFFIFFDIKIPRNFKKDYIILVEDLARLHFQKKYNFFEKIFINNLSSRSFKNAKNIICLNKKIKEEINDKLNIDESKILNIRASIINEKKKISKSKEIEIDIRKKYNIKGDFFIYDSSTKIEKNSNKLIEVFEKIKKNNFNLSLLILNENTIKDIDFRKKILEKDIKDNIFFIGKTNEFEKRYFYQNTMGVIFPFLYNSFPFEMENAINYGSQILSSELKTTKKIMKNKITYFRPNSLSSIYEAILKAKKDEVDYSEIIDENNINDSFNDLKKIIDSI